MLIRPCAPGEESALLAIFQSSVRGLAARDYTPEQIEAWSPLEPGTEMRAQWIERIRSNRPWVVEVDGCLAAFADLQPSGYIDQFFVASGFAGRGIGTALMRHLHEVARAQGIATLRAHVSLTAQPFFRGFGFVVEREQEPVVRGVALRNAAMCKRLAEKTDPGGP
ncbi:GNAT family N-acetyltransferase [Massilia suwonensis]|uniref:GNAT family N-acetyltransferase n=1 Tax=Massilia suwonensis TaxID=648895 RepID=A0ABW0MRY3_9BURK